MGNLDSAFMEYSPELESFEFEDSEWSGEGEVFNEAELMELAGELLEIDSEAELDQFLGKLIKRVGRGLGRVIRSPIGRAIGGFLKGVAKKALPLAGTALGGVFGGPLGAQIGGERSLREGLSRRIQSLARRVLDRRLGRHAPHL
jgi:hypothetical protein